MTARNLLFFACVALLACAGCAVMNRNVVYDTYDSLRPKRIGIAVQIKSILERPASGGQFSESSFYPDTTDEGSSMAYKGNSVAAAFISTDQIVSVFTGELDSKGFSCQLLSGDQFSRPDTIRNIIRTLRSTLSGRVDAVLFVDYSPLYNQYFASKGVRGNRGHSLYYRYALFDLATNQLLIRYEEVLHLDFYLDKQPSDQKMELDIASLLRKDLQNNFPKRITE